MQKSDFRKEVETIFSPIIPNKSSWTYEKSAGHPNEKMTVEKRTIEKIGSLEIEYNLSLILTRGRVNGNQAGNEPWDGYQTFEIQSLINEEKNYHINLFLINDKFSNKTIQGGFQNITASISRTLDAYRLYKAESST